MVIDSNLGYLMTVREVSTILHVHPNTLRRWADQGMIKSYRISRRGDRRFKRNDVDRFLAELNQNSSKMNTQFVADVNIQL
jgi:excisionase family DNA binding protein